MQMQSLRSCFALGSIVVFLGTFGCGGGPSSVSGKVSYNGVPVTGGSITFLMPDGKTKIPGSIDQNGNYTAQTKLTGKAEVSIETESVKKASGILASNPMTKTGAEITGEMKGKMGTTLGSGLPQYVKIPSKYADPKTSGLTVEMKSGNTTQDFNLTD
jgi:hypothetical protein